MLKFAKDTIVLYLVIVASIWGFVEAVTYFTGDALKVAIGSSWPLLYFAPLPLSIAISLVRARAGPDDVRNTDHEYKLFDSESVFSPSYEDLSEPSTRRALNRLDQQKRESIKTWIQELPNSIQEDRVKLVHDYVFKAAKAVYAMQQKWMASKGRYFQGKSTMPEPPDYSEDARVVLGVGLTDQVDDWRDVGYQEDWAPAQLCCDIYEGPDGHGFILTARVCVHATIWKIAFHYGPEKRSSIQHAQWIPEQKLQGH